MTLSAEARSTLLETIETQRFGCEISGSALYSDLLEAVAADVPSYAALKPIHPSMAVEDFVEFSGCGARLVFAFIGSNGEPGCADWHSPHFVGVDGAIGPAVDFYVNASLRVLAELR